MVRRWSFALLLIAIVSVLNTGFAVRAQNFPATKQFPPGLVHKVKELPQSHLRSQIERLPAVARDRAMAWLANFHFTELDLATLQADADGGIFYADNFQLAPVALVNSQPVVAAAAVPVSPFPGNLIFHSKPGAPNVIFLNFAGETVSGTAWNTSIGRTSIPAVPYSSDADRTTFSDSEQLSIRRMWQRVAEDYAAFNVDVTTERPATFTTRTAMAVITRNTDANGQPNPSSTAGGVSYVGAFATSTFANYRPAWIYDNNLAGEESYIAEACAHEIGHNMGLSHDGTTDGQEYYRGHGSGDTSWGPIMGASYGRNVTQWSKGDYYLANNTQDDLATIAGKLSYRTDDHGNTISAATPLVIGGGGVISSTTPETDPTNASPANKGILERNNDVDWFSFPSGSGPVSLTINPWITPGALTRGGDIDIEADLYDATGKLLMTNNSAAITYATISTNLTEGIYYLAIRNVGVGDPFNSIPSGYTTYGGIGQYFISGTVVPSSIVTPPGATLAANDITTPDVASYRFTVTYADNVAVDVSTIDSADVAVTGPNGYNKIASLVSVDALNNGTPRVATYSVTGAGALWGQADNGVYTVTMLGNAVGDTEGAFVPVRDLGTFNVAVPRVIYFANMDSDPGWTMQGLWQYGPPKYTVTTAPKAGYTGANIVGYNLSGNYGDRLAATYATTPLINCTGFSQVTLKFRRWLRLRSGDNAKIQVSTNGTTWTDVWSTTKMVADSSWQEVQYTLPSFVANSPTMQLRWGLSSGSSQNDIGWNIDDVMVLGNGAVDTAPVTAVINVPNIVTGGSPVHSFTVTYTDNVAVSVATLGDGDLYVLGPNGFSNIVQFAGVDITTDGTPRTATYTLNAPTDVWSSTNNGTYQVFLAAGEVTDTSNNAMDETLLGTFTVAISESHQALVVDPVSLTIPEGSQSAFSVKLAEAPSANVTVTIVPVSGDTNVITTAGVPIVFTPLNWNVAVPVVVNALTDADRVDAIATLEVRSDGLAAVSVLVTQTDTTPNPNLDTAPPIAALNVANILAGGATPQSIAVTYTDNVAVKVASLGDGDLYVLGPNNFSNRVSLASIDVPTDGSPRTATYALSPPNGLWLSTDNGTYQVYVAAGEVSDTSSNFTAETLLGAFSVTIPQVQQQSLIVDPLSFAILEGTNGTFTVRLAAQPSANVTVTIIPVSGDTNVITTDGVPIVFTPLNWNIAVPVVVNALTDPDRLDAIARLEVQSDGLATVSVLVTQTDTTPDPNSVPLTFESVTDASGNVSMSASSVAGVAYTLQTSVDFVNWTDVETKVAASGTISFTTNDSGEEVRFYRIKR